MTVARPGQQLAAPIAPESLPDMRALTEPGSSPSDRVSSQTVVRTPAEAISRSCSKSGLIRRICKHFAFMINGTPQMVRLQARPNQEGAYEEYRPRAASPASL